jgi:hypothetical protein
MHGECYQTYMWHAETATSERFRKNLIDPDAWTLEDPWFADQFGDIDLAATRPWALHGCRDHQLIVANCLNVEFVSKSVSRQLIGEVGYFRCWPLAAAYVGDFRGRFQE